MLYDSAVGFAVGFLVLSVVLVAWNALGRLVERLKRHDADVQKLSEAHETNAKFMWDRWQEMETKFGKIGGSAQGASDQAIAQLAARITALEASAAEQHLTVLETAEKVAHKLMDRRRKRDQDEIGEIDDPPLDPAQQLAAAKRALGVTDPAQLRLIDERTA